MPFCLPVLLRYLPLKDRTPTREDRTQPSKEKFISAPTDGYIHTAKQRVSEGRFWRLRKAGKEGAVKTGRCRDGNEKAGITTLRETRRA